MAQLHPSLTPELVGFIQRKKGREGLKEYWQQKNVVSLDQQETGIFD